MTNTERYYRTAKSHRELLRQIWAKYDAVIASLERHRGSSFYEEESKKAANDRDTAIAAAKRETAESFNEILKKMREAATNRPMAAPSSEFIGLLHALQLREHISRDELLQASRTLKENPACLAVLEELAQKNGFIGLHFAAESTASILTHIDSLERAAQKLVKLEKPDSRREQIARADAHSPNYSPMALDTILADRDFNDEDSMLSFFGNVENVTQFREAVNG